MAPSVMFNLTTGDVSHVSSTTGQAHTSAVLSLTLHHKCQPAALDGGRWCASLHTYAFPALTLLAEFIVSVVRPVSAAAASRNDELLAAMGSALAVVDASVVGTASGAAK